MIDLGFLERLLDLLNRSNADTIEVRKWTTSIRISKGRSAHSAPGDELGHRGASRAATGVAGDTMGDAGPLPAGGEHGARSGGSLLEIKSPMVGTFYAKPEPGADPYVRAGTRVSVGQTLCIIEAMKIMNPLDAEVTGTVREILVDDSQPVEFGQVLFKVEPNV